MVKKSISLVFLLFAVLSFQAVNAAVIKGQVLDKDNEAVIGATVTLLENKNLAVTDENGDFEFVGVRNGKYQIKVTCFTYKDYVQSIVLNGSIEVKVTLLPSENELTEVSVVATARKDTELSMLKAQKNSLVVQSGVSAQQIKMTQDKDASEVIQRIPGISIIDDRFVMVRGLSQRYNNVWLNNGSVPSSESDSRAFSFEIIPSSQIDNLVIVKSPAPEYPADFSGGFIMINTKEIPSSNNFNISAGTNINDNTHFKNFLYSKGSCTDFLGFDNGLRSFNGNINSGLKPIGKNGTDIQNNGFNNDWHVYNKKPIGDFSLNADLSHRFISDDGKIFSILSAINYSNSYKTLSDMKNALYGSYDTTNDRSVYLRNSVDNQYNHDVKLGAMLNCTYVSASGNNRYEFKNIFNQLGRDRYTTRIGINAQSDNEQSAEYYYRSRTTYNGQLTAHHFVGDNKIDWSAGYAYTSNYMPDRRRYTLDDSYGEMKLSNGNDLSREFTRLYEHITSANANYQRKVYIKSLPIDFKAGAFGEYKFRDYRTRDFSYQWDTPNSLPLGFRSLDITNQLLVNENYGADKLYLLENVKWSDSYSGKNSLAAGYIGVNIPYRAFQAYLGVRYEYNNMELISNTIEAKKSPKSIYYKTNDFFPSLNSSYTINSHNKLRLSYGRSINRPEFREVSPSVFYDFDLGYNVQGKYDLKSAYINNVDIKYEYYPTDLELISVSLFYKDFTNPIEWTYTVNGGTDLTYSFVNAKGADNYGVELDIRKSLDFIGLRGFGLNFNGSLIKSNVRFEPGSKEKNRPMQGQSPYLINTGIFYHNNSLNLNATILYNRIGKRIIGVGRISGTIGEESSNVPHCYEMPVNTIDMNVSKGFGRFTVKFGIKNLLSEAVTFEQIENVTTGSNNRDIHQINRRYNPGRNFNLNISYSF